MGSVGSVAKKSSFANARELTHVLTRVETHMFSATFFGP